MSITLGALPDSHGATMEALQRVATHVLARARHIATGRFGLRATPGGFGTPSFGPEATRLRVSAGRLLRRPPVPMAPAPRRSRWMVRRWQSSPRSPAST
ncbi:MAG: hypothetical protein R2749_15505 [Acidimicrobiales bacterium]